MFVAVAASAAEKADPLQNLIESEQKAYQEWLDETDEPPTAYLPGNRQAVELYSPAYRDENAQVLCHDVDLPDLLDLTQGDPTAFSTTLNLSLPRVRQAVGDGCLVRPGDRIVAVGKGWQEERTLADFTIQREKPACPDDAPYGLWMSFDKPLPEDPLFITTDSTVTVRDNLYVPADQYPVAAAGPEIMARLQGLVHFPEDYRITIVGVRDGDLEALVIFERKTVGPNDDGLPAFLAAVVTKEGVQALWTERVDVAHGTGRLDFAGSLDLYGDGNRELVFTGVHRACTYTVVFRRGDTGYLPLPLAVRSCGC